MITDKLMDQVMIHLSQNLSMMPENFLTSESTSGEWNNYGIGSIVMSPYQIWQSGSIWRVWCQTCQTDGVFLMNAANTIINVAFLVSKESKSEFLTTSCRYRCNWSVTHFSNEFSSYEKYARWQAWTKNPFIDYFAVLDIGIRWEKRVNRSRVSICALLWFWNIF